jgi:hypothetical protein
MASRSADSVSDWASKAACRAWRWGVWRDAERAGPARQPEPSQAPRAAASKPQGQRVTPTDTTPLYIDHTIYTPLHTTITVTT